MCNILGPLQFVPLDGETEAKEPSIFKVTGFEVKFKAFSLKSDLHEW